MTTVDAGAEHVSATSPYAWPFDGRLDPRATAAVVVRPASVEWPDSGSGYAVAGVAVVNAIRAAGGGVISVITADPGAVPPEHVQGEFDADSVVISRGIDGFYASALDDVLRAARIARLVLVGFGLETCVHSTMRSANDRGYECLLVSDACEPYDPDLVAASVSMIEMSGGIFGAVGQSAAVLDAFTARSEK
ncbi:isochorismatase family protein [Demequina sp.]|uniref:cysteine hydrolase family protein n=1 Tax=Demequina sp. TaxID=2050685 RepID=UPI0025E0EA69|nr:isochorismatase family protein [Demequina sp.]